MILTARGKTVRLAGKPRASGDDPVVAQNGEIVLV